MRLVLLLVVALLGACSSDQPVARFTPETDAAVTTTTTDPTITTTVAVDSQNGPRADEDLATVVQVIDGDTVDVLLDGVLETVRIIGINAPEDDECLADDATAWLRDRVDGERVALVSDTSDRDRFGRLLRYVEIPATAEVRTDVGVELVRAGLALARRYPPDVARADVIEAAQEQATDAGVGIWATDACGPAATGDVLIDAIRFDATGDDNQNPNDEWVRIRNGGSDEVDLTGWGLRDESASHRYRFPDGFVLAPDAAVTVRTGCGTDTTTDLYWCVTGSAVWNNSGDTAFLLDPAGNIADSRSG